MPRIPEANFRRDPSVRVESRLGGRLDQPNTQRLRQMGRQFGGIADQLENAKVRAESLERASKIDTRYENEFLPQVQEILKAAKHGKVPSVGTNPDGTQKEKPLSQAFSDLAREFEARASASLGDDELSKTTYQAYTRAKIETMRGRIEAEESKQIVKFHNDDIKKMTSTYIQKRLDNDPSASLYLAQLNDRIANAEPVVGRASADLHRDTIKHQIGLNAPNFIKYNDATPENIKLARQMVAGLPEAERRATERELDRTIDTMKRVSFNQMQKSVKALVSTLQGPQDFIENQKAVQDTTTQLLNTPLGEYETANARSANLGLLMGKSIASNVLFMNPAGDVQEYEKAVREQISNLRRGLASTSAAQAIGINKLTSSVMENAMKEYTSWVAKRNNDSFGLFTSIDGSIDKDISSGNPNRQAVAMEKMSSYWNRSKIPEERQFIVGRSQAVSIAKRFKELAKGDSDPSGDIAWGELTNIRNQYGEFSNKAIRNMIQLGSGTRGGDTYVPPILSVANKIKDDSLGRELLGSYNQFEDNVDTLKTNNIVTSPQNFETQFAKEFSNLNYMALYGGRGGEGNAFFQGMQEAVKVQTANLMATKNMSMEDAIQQASSSLATDVRVGTDGVNAVVVDRDFIDKYNMPTGEMNRAISNLKDLKYLDKAGIEFDFAAMERLAQSNAFLAGHIDDIKRAAPLGTSEQLKMFRDKFGDIIQVVNDPDRANTAKIYLNPPIGKPIPIPMKGANKGETESLRVDFGEYIDAMYSSERVREEQRLDAMSGMIPTL